MYLFSVPSYFRINSAILGQVVQLISSSQPAFTAHTHRNCQLWAGYQSAERNGTLAPPWGGRWDRGCLIVLRGQVLLWAVTIFDWKKTAVRMRARDIFTRRGRLEGMWCGCSLGRGGLGQSEEIRSTTNLRCQAGAWTVTKCRFRKYQ